MSGLQGRRVLVTGASGGIGGAIVRRLLTEGAEVVACGRPGDPEEALATGGARPLIVDLGSEADVRARIGPLDLDGVVNCAGVGGEIATPMETDLEVFDETMSVNARGTLLVIKHAAPGMIRAGGGSIVNISSQAALVGLAGHVSYGASKAAVDAITRVSALELGPHGIRVNSVNPTVVMTPMSAGYWGRPEIGDPFLAQIPLGRWAGVDDVAAPIVFLLGDGAAMISGVSLPIDGGYTCR